MRPPVPRLSELLSLLSLLVIVFFTSVLLLLGYGLLPALKLHIWALFLILLMAYAGFFIWRHSQRRRLARAMQGLLAAGLILLASNIAYFFILDTHRVPNEEFQPLTDVCALTDRSFQVRAGHTDWHLPQPVNVLLISEHDGSVLMEQLGWLRNLTFSRDAIGLDQFLSLLAAGTPPISELYLEGQPAHSAFQLPGNLQQREHIRWWSLGSGVHLGAISRDEELAIKYYGHLPVLLHDIHPEIDESRALLADQIADLPGFEIAGLAALGVRVTPEEQWDYMSDGRVLVVTDRRVPLSAKIKTCLRLSGLS